MKRRIIIAASIFILLIFGFMLFNGYIWFNNPSVKKYPVRGIDISHHQGIIDWEKLKETGISFVYKSNRRKGLH